MKRLRGLSLLAFLVPCLLGQAQDVSDYLDLSIDDYKSLALPPLDSLFENAKDVPRYKLAEVEEQIERNLLAKEKRSLLGYFSIRGSYQYGMFGNESSFTDVATYPYLSYTTNAQNGYTIGGAVSIPLDNIFDFPSRIKRQRLNVKSAQLQKEIKYEEIKKEIVQMYATATAQLKVMRLRAEALILANFQYEVAEKEFMNGAIKSGDLSSEKERQSTTLERFETSKLELTKSLMVLEIITHTPILRKK